MLEKLKDKFEIIRKIGQGGMAEIYLAKYKDSGEQVAIKILSPDKKNSRAIRRRFKEEIELTKKVDSPYVVKVYESHWDESIQYIVMEYIDGNIFKEYIARRSRLTADEAVDFAKQLTLGLEAIHKEGIIHRDIKASNIMVTSHGQLKIIDFGIAITEESDRLTRTDNVIGSVHYIAPEILDQHPLTPQSDVYALGILMFEMLTGDVPFKEDDAVKTALKHKKSTVPQVNKYFDTIPQAVANIVTKATAKDMKKRYKTMYEMYKDLETCLDLSRAHELPIDLNEKPKKTFKSVMNSKWTMVIIISSIIGILLAIIIALLVVS